MFQIQTHDTPIKWPVTVSVPVDGGKVQDHVFTAHFHWLDGDDLDAAAVQGDEAAAKAVLSGWGDDFSGPDGQPLPFNDETANNAVKIPYLRRAIIAAYYDMINGVESKNSERLPVVG